MCSANVVPDYRRSFMRNTVRRVFLQTFCRMTRTKTDFKVGGGGLFCGLQLKLNNVVRIDSLLIFSWSVQIISPCVLNCFEPWPCHAWIVQYSEYISGYDLRCQRACTIFSCRQPGAQFYINLLLVKLYLMLWNNLSYRSDLRSKI